MVSHYSKSLLPYSFWRATLHTLWEVSHIFFQIFVFFPVLFSFFVFYQGSCGRQPLYYQGSWPFNCCLCNQEKEENGVFPHCHYHPISRQHPEASTTSFSNAFGVFFAGRRHWPYYRRRPHSRNPLALLGSTWGWSTIYKGCSGWSAANHWKSPLLCPWRGTAFGRHWNAMLGSCYDSASCRYLRPKGRRDLLSGILRK